MSFRRWLIIVVILFLLGLVFGLSLPVSDNGGLSSEINAFEQLASFLASLPSWAMCALIFVKNVSAVLFGFILSPFFLIVPVISLVLNGWLIGVVAGMVITEKSLGFLLAGILPHGIFELPALFIGEAAAFMFGIALMQSVIHKENREQLPVKMKVTLKYLAISIALFIPAAIVETYVTPLFLK